MSTSPFLESLASESDEFGTKARLSSRYAAWDEQTRDAADRRVRYLQKLSVNSPASSVVEEIDHGSEHTACAAFLHTLRGCAEGNIRDRLNDLTYSQHVDDAGLAAIEKFRATLSSAEQMQVLRAFAIEMMNAVGEMLEHGPDDRDCPVGWTLVNPATGRQIAGELHAYFDGDPDDESTYIPRLPA